MNDNDTKQLLRSLRTVATRAIVSATVFVLPFLTEIFRVHF